MTFARIKRGLKTRWLVYRMRWFFRSYTTEDYFFLNVLYSHLKLPKVQELFYLDCGANHPKTGSNTYALYRHGASGIVVEPNPDLIRLFESMRPRDKRLGVGISDADGGALPYYCFSADTLNTFSEAERDDVLKKGAVLRETKNIEVLPVVNLEKDYLSDKEVHFMSLDVEGLDFRILKAWDFSICKPYVICVETQEYYGGKEDGFLDIARHMAESGYSIYGDTGTNTFFVRVDKIKGYEDYQI